MMIDRYLLRGTEDIITSYEDLDEATGVAKALVHNKEYVYTEVFDVALLETVWSSDEIIDNT